MTQRQMAVLAGLALLATAPTSAIEIVYDSYSPVSVARNSRAIVTLDDDGLVRRVEEYLYVTPDRHFVPEPDDRPLELFMTTVVEDVSEVACVSCARTPTALVEQETLPIRRFGDRYDRVRGQGRSEWEISFGDAERGVPSHAW